MDVNNTPYFLLRSADEFDNGSTRLSWNQTHQALVLAQNQTLRLPASDPDALTVWEGASPLALDGFNQVARIHSDGIFVEYNSGRGFLPLQDAQLNRVAAPLGNLDDLTLGGDGRRVRPTRRLAENGIDGVEKGAPEHRPARSEARPTSLL